jgi:hypothetical protein
MQPSVLPTFQPSTQPIALPSIQPSFQPSSIPTLQPSSHPSKQPSSQPSIQPSVIPTGKPSFQPTGYPSSNPTRPSPMPTTIPSASPTILTKPYFSFTSGLTLYGFTTAKLDEKSRKALVMTTAACMGVDGKDVVYLGADIIGRRIRRALAVSGLNLLVTLETTIFLMEYPAFPSDPFLIYNTLTSKLTRDVLSGLFSELLRNISKSIGSNMTMNVYCTQVINSEPMISNPVTFTSNYYLSTGIIVGIIFGSLLAGLLIMIMLFYLYPSILVSFGYEKKYYLSEIELTEDEDKQGPLEFVRISVDVSLQTSLHETEEKGIVNLIDAEKLPVFHMTRPASIEDDECPSLMDNELPRTAIEHSRDGLFKEQLRIANLKKDVTDRMQLLFKNSHDMNNKLKQRKQRIIELSDLEEKRLRDVRKNESNLSRDLNSLMEDTHEVLNRVGLQISKRVVKEKSELSLRLEVEEKAKEVRLRRPDVQKREILANEKLLIDLFCAAEEELIADLTQQKIESVQQIVEEYESKMHYVNSKKQRFMQQRSNNLTSIYSLLKDSESKVDDYRKEERVLTMTSEKDRIALSEVLKQEKAFLRAALLTYDDHYNLSLKLDQEDLILTVTNVMETVNELKAKAVDGLRRVQGEELELINILKKYEVVIDDLDKKEALAIHAHSKEMEKFVSKLKIQEVLIKSMSQSNKDRLQKYRAKEQIRIEQLNEEEQTRSKQELIDQLTRRKQEEDDRVTRQMQQRVRLVIGEEDRIERSNKQKKDDVEEKKLFEDTRRETKKDADDSSNQLKGEEEKHFKLSATEEKGCKGDVKRLEQSNKDLQYHKDEVAVENNRILNVYSIGNFVEVEMGQVLIDSMYNPLMPSEGDDKETDFNQVSIDHSADVVTGDRLDGIEEGYASERDCTSPLDNVQDIHDEDSDAKHKALSEGNHDDKIPQFSASKDKASSLRGNTTLNFRRYYCCMSLMILILFYR